MQILTLTGITWVRINSNCWESKSPAIQPGAQKTNPKSYSWLNWKPVCTHGLHRKLFTHNNLHTILIEQVSPNCISSQLLWWCTIHKREYILTSIVNFFDLYIKQYNSHKPDPLACVDCQIQNLDFGLWCRKNKLKWQLPLATIFRRAPDPIVSVHLGPSSMALCGIDHKLVAMIVFEWVRF